jgi:hypothetical protein
MCAKTIKRIRNRGGVLVITRMTDQSFFSNESLEKLAKVIEKRESEKLFDIVDDESKALLAKKELKVQGYQVRIEPFGKKFKVIAIVPDKVKYEEAVQSGAFKKLAWGRYCFQRPQEITAAFGMFKYDYDDGSVWRVMTGEDGEEYLVKEVDDEKEDEVVRVKVANTDEEIYINDNNVKSVIAILYDNVEGNAFVEDLLQSNIKSTIHSLLNDKLKKTINSEIEQNQFIKSPSYASELKGLIQTAINTKQLTTKCQLKSLVADYTKSVVEKTGKMNRMFD